MMSSNNNESELGNPRVMMWCVPRSVSTAFTKCISFVEGAEIWLEPYVICKIAEDIYGHNQHPDNDEGGFPRTLEGNEALYREIAQRLTLGDDVDSYKLERLSLVVIKNHFDSLDPQKKFVFIKDMAFGMSPSRYQYLPDKSSGFKYSFLIRNPVKVYKSYRKGLLGYLLDLDDDALKATTLARPDPKSFHCINDLPLPKDGTPYFFKAIYDLWTHVRETMHEDPVVVDMDELLDDPAAMLPVVCKALGIPYSDSLLSWDASSDVVLKWQSTCPNVRDAPRYAMWFTDAFNSSCFKRSSTSTSLDDEDVTPDIKEIAELEMPFYEKMFQTRITL